MICIWKGKLQQYVGRLHLLRDEEAVLALEMVNDRNLTSTSIMKK
ncbi:hypothetical protein [Virgibacillus sediminis]|uniref:Uncharacterized protein n=1 Tax=Virgibacillus sediminis TaxID=202260 RepID=A0ABV7A1Q8_9BACI